MYRIISFFSLLILVCCTGMQPTAVANTPTHLEVQQPEQNSSAPVQMPDRVQISKVYQLNVDSKVYQLNVDSDVTLADMITTVKYGRVLKDITWEHFPIEAEPYRPLVELRLEHFKIGIRTVEILAKFEEQGLRPATLTELLILDFIHPDLQRKFDFDIVALGSKWRRQNDKAYVPCLYMDDDEPKLTFLWGDPKVRWGEGARFLAVSK